MESIDIFLVVVFVVFTLAGIVCMLFIKGANIGRKDQEDIEQEKWLHEYEKKHECKRRKN